MGLCLVLRVVISHRTRHAHSGLRVGQGILFLGHVFGHERFHSGEVAAIVFEVIQGVGRSRLHSTSSLHFRLPFRLASSRL